jgi:hypothetical protein
MRITCSISRLFVCRPIDVPARYNYQYETDLDVRSHAQQDLRSLKQQQLARMYDVFGRWFLSSKCYLAAFIAITAFLMWPNIILEFTRNIL